MSSATFYKLCITRKTKWVKITDIDVGDVTLGVVVYEEWRDLNLLEEINQNLSKRKKE